MSAYRYRLILAICLWLLALLAPAGFAQGPADTEPAPVTKDLLEAKIAETESATDLPDATKSPLLSLYRQALGNLNEAASDRSSAQAFRQALQTAPAEARKIREAMAAATLAQARKPAAVKRSTPLDELETRLQREKADFAAADAQRADLSSRLDAEAGRPAAIRKRLQEAAGEQSDNQAQQQLATAADESPAEAQARRWALQTRADALSAEIEMLNQERLSQPARIDLLEAQQDKAAADATAIGQRVTLLEALVTAKRQAEAERLKDAAEVKRLDAEGQPPAVVHLAEQNAALSKAVAKTVAQLDVIGQQTDAANRLERQLQGDYKSAKDIIALGGSNLNDQLGNLLRQQRQSLPDSRSFEREARAREEKVGQIGVQRVLHRREQERLTDTEAYVTDLIGAAGAKARSKAMRARLVELVDERKALLAQAIDSEDLLLRKLGELEAAQTDLLATIKRFDELLDVHLLWVRSASRTQLAALGALPEQVWRIVSPTGWYGVAGVLAYQVTHSAAFILLAVALAGFLWGRKHLIQLIESRAAGLGKPTTDQFVYTLQALVVTLVAAGAWPLVTAVVGWQLQVSSRATDFSGAVGQALLALAMQFYLLRALRLICMPRGLAAAHFRWPEPKLRLLRLELERLSWTYLPAAGVLLVIVHLDPLNAGWAAGRVAFVILVASLSFSLFRLLHPRTGILAHAGRQPEQLTLPLLHPFWYPLLVMAPLALGVLDLLGYIDTAGILLNRFVNSLWLVVALVLLSALARRGLKVAHRRIAYETALRRRQAAQEAQPQEPQPGSADDKPDRPEVNEPEADLSSLSDTSSALIRTTATTAGIIGLWIIWADVFPALQVLDDVVLWHQTVTAGGAQRVDPISLADLGLAFVIAIATVILAKQLPAVLEMLLLRRADMPAGTRYAATTLTAYAVVTLGLVLVFASLGVQWSQLQWLVAALGVGIGFGLQEIVANFVSGLIILFERPVRVGDIVTVGDTDGVVTRIRIRATTIRNWDRKELLVPNKDLVTGRVLNWSLSDKMTRVVVVAGVAYESDVDAALDLMREAAREHPKILDDPAPVLSFEGFGDNSLTLILRAYLGSIDDRVATITALHKAVYRKFAKAGIVIAFPQRDLHLDAARPLQVELRATHVRRDVIGPPD
ncbi:MAG: mechanosensitive ion channel [Thiohalocapsa sp.]|uniref:mechanosensitive ion channel domain-containing protein n=1 Tax=Thiohalocapsa sp. TaxID=2497641 RepID=UPI0025FB16C8|nr:mechanosensitive ion channel domain-containing protein [Thiohalocapsa sp.]MCG6940714.1 mechanosensitive ion channel [Thiohalocapsa sp.]